MSSITHPHAISSQKSPRHSSVRVTRKHRQRERHDALTGWMFLLPFAIIFILVFIIPIIVAIQKSFYREEASGGGLYGSGGAVASRFVGFDNFAFVLQSSIFWKGMGRMVLFGLFQIPFMIIFALALALILDSFLVKHVGFFRLMNFLPYAIPGIIAAMVWAYLYDKDMSPFLPFIRSLIPQFDFGGHGIVLVSMANITTWTFTGYNMLIFLAALQAIPRELYEAARIDGASGWQITTRIKIPLVSSAALLAVLLSIIGTIQLFNEPTIMASQNIWMGKSYTPMMMTYNTMMGTLTPSGDGPASAISIVMAIIAGVLAAVYALVQSRLQK